MSACPLCQELGGELVWQDELCRVVLPDEPQHPGLVRVIAQEHVREMTDLGAAQRDRLMDLVWTVEAVVRSVMQADKVNLASLGNVVAHVHWHVVPRYQDDAHFPATIWSPATQSVTPARMAQWQDRARGLAATLRTHLTET